MPDDSSRTLHRQATSAIGEGANEHPTPGEHYRETATWLREIAEECRNAGEREEFLRLAVLFDRRGNKLDRRSPGGEAWVA